jgi:esterase/lipase
MAKKIVVTFPGGNGIEIPLLYYGANHFAELGFEKIFIKPPYSQGSSFEDILANAESIIRTIDFSEYEEVVFIAKSLGTLVACRIKEIYNIPASLVLFTPLEDTLQYIKRTNDVLLVAIGAKDKYLSAEKLNEHCKHENIKLYIESGVGHRMEVANDLRRNLDIVFNVIMQLDHYSGDVVCKFHL